MLTYLRRLVDERTSLTELMTRTAETAAAEDRDLTFEPASTVYIVGRNTPVVTQKRDMLMWRKRLFALMTRNSQAAYHYFNIPTHRLLEIGGQTEL